MYIFSLKNVLQFKFLVEHLLIINVSSTMPNNHKLFVAVEITLSWPPHTHTPGQDQQTCHLSNLYIR